MSSQDKGRPRGRIHQGETGEGTGGRRPSASAGEDPQETPRPQAPSLQAGDGKLLPRKLPVLRRSVIAVCADSRALSRSLRPRLTGNPTSVYKLRVGKRGGLSAGRLRGRESGLLCGVAARPQ